jgi:subtilisin
VCEIAHEEGVKPTQRFGTAVRGFAAKLDPADVRDIRRDKRVAAVVPDKPMKATGLVPLLPGDNIPTGVRRVGAAVDSTVREASRVNVAVIDTGIDLSHPDLNAVSGTDCTGSGTARDGNSHGTHVAGIIGARNNGSGAVGVAPGAKLWAVRVLGSNGSGLTSQVICGIDWVTSTRTDSDPNNDIAVANMSLGSSGPPSDNCGRTIGDAMHIAICDSVAAGVTYVVAAGNSGADEQNFVPANYPEVITVTAMGDSDGLPGGRGGQLSCSGTADDTWASFSNYATRAADVARTIAAPGVCIRSTYPGGYATMSGTSMASPHVTGLVALCEGDGSTAGPCWGKSPADVRTIVRQAAADQSTVDPSSGFAGDPTRPTGGRYYGYLASTRFPGTRSPDPAPPVNSVKPTISGSAAVGATLTSSDGTWTGTAPIAYRRQWLRCTTVATTSCTELAGATSDTYTPVAADAGRHLRVRVTATNTKASTVAYSEPTAAVVVPKTKPTLVTEPKIVGAARVGLPLTATPGTWTGAAPIRFTFSWALCAPGSSTCSYNGVKGVSFTPPKSTPVGTRVVVVVTAQNSVGTTFAQSRTTEPLGR